MKKAVLLGLIALLVVPVFVLALQNEEKITCITEEVYEGCRGKDIILKENWFINSGETAFITLLPWQDYDRDVVKETIKYISQREPYATITGHTSSEYGELYYNIHYKTIELGGKSFQTSNIGSKILKCGDNFLDVSERDYFWNGIEISCSKEINVNEGGKATFGTGDIIETGDNSQVTTGDNSPINCSKSNTLSAIIASILGAVAGTLITHFLQKKKKR